MTLSFTLSDSQTFTVTDARKMASKVAADLKRFQRLYGHPSDTGISEYETEVIELLKAGYLGTVSYGFWRDNAWIEPSVHYTARDLDGGISNDDDPGKVKPNANVDGASFYSYLTYSSAWGKLTDQQRDAFKKSLPFYRGGASAPSINGYLVEDRSYSSGGKALSRSTVRSF